MVLPFIGYFHFLQKKGKSKTLDNGNGVKECFKVNHTYSGSLKPLEFHGVKTI